MPSWRPIKITAHRKEKEKAKKKEDAERTKNVTGIPEGTIRKAGPDETVLPPRQREAHTRPRREKDKCAVINLNLAMNFLSVTTFQISSERLKRFHKILNCKG